MCRPNVVVLVQTFWNFFIMVLLIFYKSLHERIIFRNLNTEFCKFRREFNLGPKVLNALVGVIPLTLRRLMSFIYGAPILDVSRSHTTTQHSR